ncbi:MAG: tetratricopeptide repeat protein, partial [Phycisphaerales bacterium]
MRNSATLRLNLSDGGACAPGPVKLGHGRPVLLAACIVLLAESICAASASSLDTSREQFKTGQYAQCLESSRKAIEDGAYRTEWQILVIESLMALGQYDTAAEQVAIVMKDYRPTIRLLKLAHDVYLRNGQAEQAAVMLNVVYRIASFRRIESLSSSDVVALGQSLLLLGIEPRVVLDEFYNWAMRNDPNCLEAYLAAGSLAMDKQDYELAASQYREALKRFGSDPDVHYGLARALCQSDRNSMIESLDAAFHVNPRHQPALILLAEHHIDCEDYDAAAESLDRVLAVNPWHPDAWAYRAVLAHMGNDPNAVNSSRVNGLRFWPNNPRVDHLIGRKLSQKYRFAEGATYQRQALEVDPDYQPAKIQLAQDLLRLGEEQRGWALADEVCTADAYNIEAYNLVNLRDTLAKFRTLQADAFVVRMDELEAAVYGDRVVKLLQQARSELCKKYGLDLERPVTVELFPNQQDFAVRTFGMPGGDGFLGVCFGNVITANSPKAENPSNWQSLLWHEFCHVVTLNLTRNKMPRWLSEGISVYEESQRDPTWGQRMNPQYRKMILGGDMVPVGHLSAAFLNPPSPAHLQFAYYQSSLVVEFLIEQFGFACIKAILADLERGEKINAAIARLAAPLEKIEKQFESFARKRAQDLAQDLDFEQPQSEQVVRGDRQAVAEWLDKRPNNFWALTLHADNLLADREWEQAKGPLKKLISLYPQNIDEGNPYQLLAEAHRQLGQIVEECQVLNKLAALSSDAAYAYGRLMEIGVEQKNWQQVIESGEKYLTVYPLQATVYLRLGRANEELGRDEQAIESYQRLLLLDPADPADVNYRIARLLHERDPAAAKRHILEALADAPRFR